MCRSARALLSTYHRTKNVTATGTAASAPATSLLRMCVCKRPISVLDADNRPGAKTGAPRSGEQEGSDAAGRGERRVDLGGGDDVDGADAGGEGRAGLLELGDHPAGNRAAADGFARLGDGEARQQGRRIVLVPPDATDGGAGDERPGADSRRELAGDDVGVDVEHLTVGAGAQAGDDRQVAGAVEQLEERQIEAVDVAHQPEVDGDTVGAGDGARWTAVGVDEAAGAGEADHRRAGRAQRRDQIDVELPGDDHLQDLEGRRVGDSPAADQTRLDPQAARHLRRLRPAAVNDDQTPPGRACPRDRRRGDGEHRREQHVAAQLYDRVDYGQGPGSSSEAVSGRPSIRFMFWIAWPAPPLIRLSSALTTASVRDEPAAGPSVNPTSA